MADIFSVRAPIAMRHPGGGEEVLAGVYPHAEGLLYLRLYWHLGQPEETIQVIEGKLTGDGPWKIGAHVLRVLGCHGTDGDLALDFEKWKLYLDTNAESYPPPPLCEAIVRRRGACI